MHEDFDGCYRAVSSRDTRFDGRFVTAVRTTGIYCRPSCPAQTPRRENVRFFPRGGGRRRSRVPGLQTMPARCRPGQPRLGCPGRSRSARAARHRERCRRHRRSARAGPTAGGERAAPASHLGPGDRRRTARAGTYPTSTDRADAHRTHGASPDDRRVQCRFRERPAVQRRDARGVRRRHRASFAARPSPQARRPAR